MILIPCTKVNILLQSDVSSKDREVTHDQLKQWCDDNKIATYIETSAKNDNNVVEAFSMAVQRCVFIRIYVLS